MTCVASLLFAVALLTAAQQAPAAHQAAGAEQASAAQEVTRANAGARGAADAASTGLAAPAADALTLQPGEVARIEGLAILDVADFNRYLGTIYARLPEGDEALQQLLGEALIESDAEARGLNATDADVDAAIVALDEQARAAAGSDGKGLIESIQANVDTAAIRRAIRLLVLHERLLRAEQSLPPEAPIEPQQMHDWLTRRVATVTLLPAPLDDAQAAAYEGGAISKAAVGARLATTLGPKDVSGVLTEMIGVLLVRRQAGVLGIDLTTAAATREIIERDGALRAQPGAGNVTYQEFVEQVQKRTLAELLTSDKFSTEVLLRLLVEHDVDEDEARAFWEQNRDAFVKASNGKLSAASAWDAAAPLVWRELRLRTYRRLFEQSRIARRF